MSLSSSYYDIIDTTTGVSSMVDALTGLPNRPPSLYIDLEGIKLSRNGSISILQIHNRTTEHTYLVDIKTLGSTAFTTRGQTYATATTATTTTLQALLESPEVHKVFFDVRRGSDALYAHYGIALRGVRDLQLMEVAARASPRGRGLGSHVDSLQRCVERDLGLTSAERHLWAATERAARCLFMPEHGGAREAFDFRPLPARIRRCCVQHVRYLPRLWDAYSARLEDEWRRRVCVESRLRVIHSQSADFDPDRRATETPRRWVGLY